jgi:hypothetical protein
MARSLGQKGGPESPIEGTEWDPTEPTLPEMVDDWDTWAEMLGQDHAMDRMIALCLQLREKYDEPFQIRPGKLMDSVGSIHNRIEYEHAQYMCRAINDNFAIYTRIGPQGLSMMAMQEGLLVPSPGHDDMGLPRLDIRDVEVYVVIANTGLLESREVRLTLFTVNRISLDEKVCPLCQQEYDLFVSKLTRNDYIEIRTKQCETDRFFSSLKHIHHMCTIQPGDFFIHSYYVICLHNGQGSPWPISDLEGARRVIRAWCARTPGLVHLPCSHVQRLSLGWGFNPVEGEVRVLLSVHKLLGRVSDAEVVQVIEDDPVLMHEIAQSQHGSRGKITLGTVKRWRKALGLPGVKP